ncbi:hypothetical protein F8568_044885 [Actinomadura sp. LD22]|uniref:Uncharacterized protein n=1 Tax=Actinomadura physcomitrii TaxID=2650748 RepID=A0A6I4MYC4_9ACTN|nr:helix-turn-helix domain-containing protein [Actinomadura physcomitrii]MWA07346.1 hypothetical protein [Actinomadura physcomitrii]
MLRGERTLPADIVEDERRSGARRACQGISPEIVVAVYRAVIGILRDEFMDSASRTGASVDAMLDGIRRLWVLTDHFSSTLVAARYEVDLSDAREAEQRKVSFVRLALDPTSDPHDVVAACVRHGLRADGAYWLVRAAARSESIAAVQAALKPAHPIDGFGGVLVSDYGTVEGILPTRPREPTGTDVAVAVAGPVGPVDFARAASESRRALRTARQFGLTGLHDRDSLGILVSISEDHELSELLRRRYVDPVRRGSTISEDIFETVDAYLDRHSIPHAAAKLFIHVNTVRYRLRSSPS